MKPATTQLQNFLLAWNPSTVVRMPNLYTFTLPTGEIFRFTDFQAQVIAPAPNTSSPNFVFVTGPGLKRGQIKTQIGPQIDELDIEIFANNQQLLGFASGGTLTWQQAVYYGIFDGATCEVDRAYLSYDPPNYLVPTMQGTVCLFYGRVGDIENGRTAIKMKVKPLLDLLNIQMPRRLFQSACNHKFGEPGTGMCGYDRVNGTNALGVATGIGAVNITSGAASTPDAITTSFAPNPPTAYDNGTILGTSGLNNGFVRTIGKVDSGTIFFLKPWIFVVVGGVDTFALLPGCDRTLATCTGTFQNQLRYGGFPYIPPPETAI